MVRVVEGKIYRKWPQGKRKLVRVNRSSSYRGKNYSECMTGIQGKSILVRISARLELARVWVIGSRLYFNPWDAGIHKIPANVILKLMVCGHIRIPCYQHANNPRLQTGETVSRFELHSSVKKSFQRREMARDLEKQSSSLGPKIEI